MPEKQETKTVIETREENIQEANRGQHIEWPYNKDAGISQISKSEANSYLVVNYFSGSIKWSPASLWKANNGHWVQLSLKVSAGEGNGYKHQAGKGLVEAAESSVLVQAKWQQRGKARMHPKEHQHGLSGK